MELKAEVVVNAPAGAAWAIIGEHFGRIGEWATPISASSLDGDPCVGAVRTCHIAGFGPVKPGVIRERLVAFDPVSRSFAYEAAEGMPRFFGYAINRWSVHALDDRRCVVRIHATLQLRGPMRMLGLLLKIKMSRDSRGVLEELCHRIEAGTPHPRKLEALAKQRVVATQAS